MSRTKGSGWGGGVILYQICPYCNRKKAMYIGYSFSMFKCTACKRYFNSNKLLPLTFRSQLSDNDIS